MARLIDRVLPVMVIIVIAYGLPLIAYASWAWSHDCFPEKWPEEYLIAVEPLGYAWQYWYPTAGQTPGSDFWKDTAYEQGARWRTVALCAALSILIAIISLVVWRRLYRVKRLLTSSCATSK